VAAVLGICIATGCGGDSERPAHPADVPPTARERAERTKQQAARPAAPTCPPAAANCKAAAGRVVGLESVDADGDGDLHLLIASRTSITLPGITVLDINKDLRPADDPRVGDWAAGAGPVYTGSYGQSQIQVERVVFDPRRG
jgi:hypothetical protein